MGRGGSNVPKIKQQVSSKAATSPCCLPTCERSQSQCFKQQIRSVLILCRQVPSLGDNALARVSPTNHF